MPWRERPIVKYFLAEIPVLGDLIFSTKPWDVAVHDAAKCVTGFAGMTIANEMMKPAETEMTVGEITRNTLAMALALTLAKVSFNAVREVCRYCCCSSCCCKRGQGTALHQYNELKNKQSLPTNRSATNTPDAPDTADDGPYAAEDSELQATHTAVVPPADPISPAAQRGT
jgi:hypothetical protein